MDRQDAIGEVRYLAAMLEAEYGGDAQADEILLALGVTQADLDAADAQLGADAQARELDRTASVRSSADFVKSKHVGGVSLLDFTLR